MHAPSEEISHHYFLLLSAITINYSGIIFIEGQPHVTE